MKFDLETHKNDYLYFLLAVVLAALSAWAVRNLDSNIGLFGLVGAAGIAFALAIFVKPSLGVNVLILAVFTNISDELTGRGYPGIIKPLVVVVAAAIFARYLYVERTSFLGRPKTAAIEMFLFLFFAVTAATFIVASNRDRALNAILDLGKDIVIIYCIIFALRAPEIWKRSVWLVILITFFLSLLGTYQYVTGSFERDFFGMAAVKMDNVFGGSSTARLGGPINAPNMWGQTVVAVMALVVFRFIHEPRRAMKIFLVLVLGILLVETLNTYSRGAYLSLLVVAVLVLLVFEKRVNRLAGLAILALFALSIPFWPGDYVERLRSLSVLAPANEYGIYQESSVRGRSSEMLTGLSMFAAHPLLGVGAGNYNNNYQQYSQLIGIEVRSEERDPHSLYIQVLAENGILGFAAFAGVIVSLFAALSVAKRRAESASHLDDWIPWLTSMQVSLIAYLVAATFLHGAYIRYFWILTALAIAAIRITHALIDKDERISFTGARP